MARSRSLVRAISLSAVRLAWLVSRRSSELLRLRAVNRHSQRPREHHEPSTDRKLQKTNNTPLVAGLVEGGDQITKRKCFDSKGVFFGGEIGREAQAGRSVTARIRYHSPGPELPQRAQRRAVRTARRTSRSAQMNQIGPTALLTIPSKTTKRRLGSME